MEEGTGDDRHIVRTISSCEKELDDIQSLLEGLSSDINEKINEKTSTIGRNPAALPRKMSSSDSLHLVLSCSSFDFERKTDRMSVTDLDLTRMTLEAELKMLQSYLQQTNSLDEEEIQSVKLKISLVQDRMFRCITKKGQAIAEEGEFLRKSRYGPDENDDEEEDNPPPKPKRFITRNSVHPQELEDFSVSQLEVVLRHNSIDFPDSSNRDTLLKLVADELLKSEDWDLPAIESTQWKNASDLGKGDLVEVSTDDSRPTTPKSPIDKNYFSLKPGGLEDYMKYKAMNDAKLTDWDPTDLLKELYSKITEGGRSLKKAATLKSKKVHCMQGYLEKLPMNQTKVKTFKGWRRRFFQVARGKLFYYEDHKAETPFGSIDILGSEVEAGEHRTILITSRLQFGTNKIMEGNKLVLRCNLDSELNDWLAALKTMASIEPLPETFKREGSLKKKQKNHNVVIIDLGSATVRAGLSTDTLPVLAFPAAFSVKRQETRNGRRFTEAGLPDPHSCRCGFEAFYPANRKDAKIVYPIKSTLKVDKHSIKARYLPGFLEKVFHDLDVESTDAVVIISCPRFMGPKDKEFILNYMFSEMNIQAVYMEQQALFSLFSYGVTTGLIVDIGDHLDVLPVIEGTVIEKGAASLPYAGQQITEYLGKLLTENGHRFFSDMESFIVRYVKELIAEASSDFEEDMMSSPKPVDVDIERFHLPDDRRNIRVGNMKYRCVEGLFNPGLWGKDDIPLQNVIERSIKACEIDMRKELSKNIYLSGGSSCIKELSRRLEEELKLCLPDSTTIQITASEHRLNAAFKGATVVAGLDNFKDLLITREEWNTTGIETLKKWNC